MQVTKVPSRWGDVGPAGGCALGKQRVFGKSLSSLLNFAMNIRLLLKRKTKN